MYLDYCLIALTVILLTSAFLAVFLGKRKLLDKENKANLMICTALAVMCAICTFPLAKLMVVWLYFSIPLSIAASVFLCVAASAVIFLLMKRSRKLKASEEQPGNPDGQTTDIAAEPMLPAESTNITTESGLPAESTNMAVEPGLPAESTDIAGQSGFPTESAKQEIAATMDESETPSPESMTGTPIFDHIPERESPEQIPVIPEPVSAPNPVLASAPVSTPETRAADHAVEAPTLSDLLNEASSCKNHGNRQRAIVLYEAALLLNPGEELLAWIILDLCSLYKMTNQKELIYKILNSEYSNLLNMQIKEDILRNI